MTYVDRYKEMRDKFSQSFPSIANKVVDGYLSSRWETTFYLDDRTIAIYDHRNNTVRFRRDESLSDDDWGVEFARRLRKRMTWIRIDQEELAEKIGVSQSVISKYTRGVSIPNARVLAKIANVLECSITELCDF